MSFIVFDTETTGLDPAKDRIIELAGMKLGPEPGTGLTFSELCDPGVACSFEAMATHHIRPWEWQGKPTPETITLQMLRQFELGGVPRVIFAAHNVKFDRAFMEPLLGDFRPQWYCSLRCAIMLWPDAPRHTNQVLRYYLSLEPNVPEGLAPHRALYDVIVTEAIIREQLKLAPLSQLLDWSNNPILLPKVPFGKHRGKLWSEVDRGYLRWCTQQPDIDEDVLYTARYWMDRH